MVGGVYYHSCSFTTVITTEVLRDADLPFKCSLICLFCNDLLLFNNAFNVDTDGQNPAIVSDLKSSRLCAAPLTISPFFQLKGFLLVCTCCNYWTTNV